MFRRILILAFLCICAGTLQDLSNIQVHGFVAGKVITAGSIPQIVGGKRK
jgi:hypothetical protein